MSNMVKELERLEEGPKVEIQTDLLRTTQRKISNWKTPGHDRILVLEIHLYSQKTSTQNEQMPTRSTLIRMYDQRKDHIDLERHPQRNCPGQLQIHNLPTNVVENINSKNKGRDLLLTNKPGVISRRI